MLLALTNYTCVKYSMSTQAWKVFTTHAHEISGYKIISRIIHARDPHLGVMNVDIQSDIVTLELKNVEQIEVLITQFSGIDKKLNSLEKLYLLKDFYSSTRRHLKIVWTQGIHCAQYYRYNQINWQQLKIGYIHRGKHSWNLSLSS